MYCFCGLIRVIFEVCSNSDLFIVLSSERLAEDIVNDTFDLLADISLPVFLLYLNEFLSSSRDKVCHWTQVENLIFFIRLDMTLYLNLLFFPVSTFFLSRSLFSLSVCPQFGLKMDGCHYKWQLEPQQTKGTTPRITAQLNAKPLSTSITHSSQVKL